MDLYELPMSVPLGPWREHALCAAMCRAGEAETEWWHPPRGGKSAQAIAICKRCPVKDDCLEHAVVNGERDGVWGGTGPKGRATPRNQEKVRMIVCRRCREVFRHVGFGNRLYCDACRLANHQDHNRVNKRKRVA